MNADEKTREEAEERIRKAKARRDFRREERKADTEAAQIAVAKLEEVESLLRSARRELSRLPIRYSGHHDEHPLVTAPAPDITAAIRKVQAKIVHAEENVASRRYSSQEEADAMPKGYETSTI